MNEDRKDIETPLLEPLPSGTSSKLQTLGNITVSIVGTGVLGLPFAFRTAGWLAGSIGVAVVGLATFYCMLLLVGLCLGLVFTFPIMLHPINEILERNLRRVFHKPSSNDNSDSTTRLEKLGIYISRTIVGLVLAVLAFCVPAFGVLASLVGSTVCALLSFVLPATFHLKLYGPSLKLWQRALDFCLLLCGLFLAVYGTYNTVVGI